MERDHRLQRRSDTFGVCEHGGQRQKHKVGPVPNDADDNADDGHLPQAFGADFQAGEALGRGGAQDHGNQHEAEPDDWNEKKYKGCPFDLGAAQQRDARIFALSFLSA